MRRNLTYSIMAKNMIALIKTLSDRPISFHRAYVKLTGSVNAALMLSQAMYWASRTSDPDGWFYKTSKDWEDETGMGRHEQDTARKQLKKSGFWVEKLRGVPATLNYRIDFEKMISSLSESGKLDCCNSPNKIAGNSQTSPYSTETTTETTISDSKESGQLSLVTETKKAAKKEKLPYYPEYPKFIDLWVKHYPTIGIKMPRDGAKIKSLIEETRRQVQLAGHVITEESVCQFWDHFLSKLKSNWYNGKDLPTIESKYSTIIFEMINGKQQPTASKSQQARNFIDSLPD